MAVTLETIARNAACNAIVDLVDVGTAAGKLQFKTSGGTSVFGNGAVATLTFADPAAFGNAATGVATAEAITSDTNAAGGTTTKAYFYDGDNAPVLWCSVASPTGGDINLTNNVIAATETVAVTALTVTVPAAA
jgi:hypothetical protein